MPTWPASGRASTSSRARSPPPTRDCSRPHSTPASLRRPTTAPCGASPRPRRPCARPRPRSRQAKKAVKDQRSGIVTFVTESYQNGTELNSATAVMGGEGPKGLMNRYGVVESAGDSMEAAYDDFRKATVVAKAYTKKAAKAQKRQESLADEARELRNAAEAAANSAAVAAGQIATQKEQLVQALAEAQNISVELAGKRQQAMEQIAQEKAAAAAQAAGARGGQGGTASTDRQGVGARREVCQARPRPGTERQQVHRILDRWRLRRPRPAGQRLTARTRQRRAARGRLRQGAAGQALPLGSGRPERLRLLRPDDDGLAPGRQVPPALVGRPVPAEHADRRRQSPPGRPRLLGFAAPARSTTWRCTSATGRSSTLRARASRCRSTACTTGCRRTTSRVPDASGQRSRDPRARCELVHPPVTE